MRRGTRVGQAYIALTADGSGINDDIADSLDGVDYDEFGDRHGREYSERFRSHMDGMSESFSSMLQGLGRAIETDESITQGIRRQINDSFTAGDLDPLVEGVGRRLGVQMGGEMQTEIERAVRDSVNNSLQRAGRDANFDMGDFMRGITTDEDGSGISIVGPILDRATAEARVSMERQAREMIEVHSEALSENAEHDSEAMAARQRMYAEMFNTIDAREQRSAEVYAALLRGQESALERSLADRAQAEDDDARRRNRERIRYEVEFSRMLDEQDAERAVEQERRDAEFSRMERQRDDDRFRRFDEMARRMTRNISLDPRINTDQINASLRRLRADLEAQDDIRLRLNADLPVRERERIQAELEGIRARIRVSLNEEELNKSMLRAQGIIDRVVSQNRDGDTLLGSRIGGMLGAGSRNNFLNIIGKSIGGIINLVQRMTRGISSFVSTFQQGMASAGSGADGFTRFMGGASASMSALAASAPALLIALGAIILSMSIMASVASALAAILVAMTSTIVSGLTGALIVAGGAFAAAAAAGGLLAVAFTSMTDAQSALLSASFQPLKAGLTGIGQLMITQMIPYFSTWASNLQNALVMLAPLASVMGQAFGRAGNILTAAFSGPGFQAFVNALTTYLPGIVTNLASALGGFLNGLLGTFAVLMPYVNQFAGYLARVAERFSNWANSAQGQNAIVDFTERALNSLESLWNFTKQVMGFISDLLFSPQAQNAGNSIFDSLARSFENFRKQLQENIADGDFEQWFRDGIEFGKDLKDVIVGIKDIFMALNNSGVLTAVGNMLTSIGVTFSWMSQMANPVIGFVETFASAMSRAVDPVRELAEEVQWLGDLIARVTGAGRYAVAKTSATDLPNFAGVGLAALGGSAGNLPAGSGAGFNWDDLMQSGNDALNATSESNGGYVPDPVKAPYESPYKDWAEQMLRDGENVAAEMRKAMREVNKEIAKAIREAANAPDVKSARSALSAAMENAISTGETLVDNAQSALDNATRTLGSTGSARETAAALKQWYKMRDNLMKAYKNQANLEKVAARIGMQKRVDPARVNNLVNGFRQTDASLAEYAAARARIATKLEKANQKLIDALALRNDYKAQVVDSTRVFASIITAQAKTIDGVEQALTAGDITTNLQERLDKIKAFQENLRKLLAFGLSNDAYKQLVDAGVEQGGAYAQAILDGGQGAVGQVNGLTAQINAAANALGADASNRLYQAGVDAARGLVEGLESMSEQLDSAATRLGNSIAKAIKKALGIHSPSTVMRDLMNPVGDGAVIGLDRQHSKVGAAAARLAGQIAVSPEVARYAAAQEGSASVSQNLAGVSGNEHHWHISTPTEDPKAVAQEMMNEMTGRLG